MPDADDSKCNDPVFAIWYPAIRLQCFNDREFMTELIISKGKKIFEILAGFFASGKKITTNRDKTTVSDKEAFEALDQSIRSL